MTWQPILGRALDTDDRKTWIVFDKAGHSGVELAAGMFGAPKSETNTPK